MIFPHVIYKDPVFTSPGVKTSSRETAAIIGVGVAGTVLGITAILVLVVLIYIIKRRYIKS